MKDVGDVLAQNISDRASAIHQITQNIESVKTQTVNQRASVTETSATIEQVISRLGELTATLKYKLQVLRNLPQQLNKWLLT